MASAQVAHCGPSQPRAAVSPVAQSRGKRRFSLDDSTAHPEAVGYAACTASPAARKRVCRLSGVDAALRTDVHGPARYVERRAAMAAIGLLEPSAARLLDGLRGDADALRRLVDLNTHVVGVRGVLAEYAARDVSLAAVNVRAHSFRSASKEEVLANFAGAYREETWLRDVVAFVARECFARERVIEIAVLSGGGVRDVLIADWCALYRITSGHCPPQIIIISAPDGRTFLIPYIAGSAMP